MPLPVEIDPARIAQARSLFMSGKATELASRQSRTLSALRLPRDPEPPFRIVFGDMGVPGVAETNALAARIRARGVPCTTSGNVIMFSVDGDATAQASAVVAIVQSALEGELI